MDEYFCHLDPASVREGDIVFVNSFLLCECPDSVFFIPSFSFFFIPSFSVSVPDSVFILTIFAMQVLFVVRNECLFPLCVSAQSPTWCSCPQILSKSSRGKCKSAIVLLSSTLHSAVAFFLVVFSLWRFLFFVCNFSHIL